MTVRLGLTMGDPAGIGPEIVLAAARDLAPRAAAGELALLAIGTPRCFEETARRLSIPAAIVAGGCSATSTDRHEAAVEHYTLHSRLLGRDMRQAAVVPPGAEGERRPLLVFLHGATDSDRGEDASLDEPLFAALRALGDRAPIVVFPNGGNFSYWHDRGAAAGGATSCARSSRRRCGAWGPTRGASRSAASRWAGSGR